MRGFQGAAKTSQPVLTEEEIEVIFQNIPQLYDIHSRFIKALEPKLKNWNGDQAIGECFKMLVSCYSSESVLNVTIPLQNRANDEFTELSVC